MFLFYTLRQNIKDIENELDKNRREHEQFNQDINANKVTTLSQNHECMPRLNKFQFRY